MLGRPQPNEAAAYYSTYIDRVTSDDIVAVLSTQKDEAREFLSGISEEQSLHRYEPGKWSMRELLGHVNDTERVFMYRALWFARGFTDACRASIRKSVLSRQAQMTFPGPTILTSSLQFVRRLFRFSATCLKTRGFAPAWRATTRFRCVRSPTSSPDTFHTISRFFASAT